MEPAQVKVNIHTSLCVPKALSLLANHIFKKESSNAKESFLLVVVLVMYDEHFLVIFRTSDT